MQAELTNLLPRDRARKNTREYFVHLGVIVLLALTVVVVGSGVLLAPSYLYLHSTIATSEAQLADFAARSSSAEGQEASARITALTNDATYLTRLASTTSASRAIEALLGVPRPGVVLTTFSYTPPAKGADGRLALTGTASTRETLRSYVAALAHLPYVANADLPISAYAKDTNIPFTVTLTGTLKP